MYKLSVLCVGLYAVFLHRTMDTGQVLCKVFCFKFVDVSCEVLLNYGWILCTILGRTISTFCVQLWRTMGRFHVQLQGSLLFGFMYSFNVPWVDPMYRFRFQIQFFS